jgi:hypothetical protein
MRQQDRSFQKINKATLNKEKVQTNTQIIRIKSWINSKRKDKDTLKGWDKAPKNRKEIQQDKVSL